MEQSLDRFWRRQCVSCDGAAPSCNCGEGEKCILTGRTCNQCPTIQCIPSGSGSSSKSVNPGIIAGPVVAVLLIASLAALWWLRRKRKRALERLEELAQRARKAESKSFHLSQPGSPTPGSANSARSGSQRGSSREAGSALNSAGLRSGQRSPLPHVPVNAEYYDENGATIRVYKGNVGTIDLRRDPFSDRQSVSTEGSGQQSMHIIPIQYIPSAETDETAMKKRPVSQAARTLDEARKNLLRPGQAPPRPARSPDLDLRLNPPVGDTGLRSPTANDYRDSFLSGNSGAASFLSGSTDLHFDAPKIVTSRQVHVGRVQQAEVVQMLPGSGPNKHLSPDDARDPFEGKSPPSPSSPATFGNRSFGVGSGVSGAASGTSSFRTLTPTSHHYEDGESIRDGQEPSSAGATDLRFSMGSLARDSVRDSVSTMATGRYLAQAHLQSADGMVLPPRIGLGFGGNGLGSGARESIASGKSGTDSVLGGFPIIPPTQSQFTASNTGSGLPQSTSASTLEHATLISRPPPSYRPPPPSSFNTNSRIAQSANVVTASAGNVNNRDTTHSVADSLLGTFPFVPPTQGDLDTLPHPARHGSVSAPNARSPISPEGRNTQGMSTTSEGLGLGGFDFNFEGRVSRDSEQPVRRR